FPAMRTLSSIVLRPRPRPTLFPYTTLFRSRGAAVGHDRPGWAVSEPRADHHRRPRRLRAAQARDRRHRRVGRQRPPLLRPREGRSEEHTSELQSPYDLVCRLLLEKKKQKKI